MKNPFNPHPTLTDTYKYAEVDLLAMLAASEEIALVHIYEQFWQPLFVSAFNVLKDKAACEDIIQETFLQLWLKRETIRITSSLSAYLHTAVRYQVFRQIKKDSSKEHLFEQLDQRIAASSADKSLHLKELNEQINAVVQTLPEQCRLIYTMSRDAHLSHKEIAEKLSISTKTVENQLTIALRRLRIALGDLGLITAIIIIKNMY